MQKKPGRETLAEKQMGCHGNCRTSLFLHQSPSSPRGKRLAFWEFSRASSCLPKPTCFSGRGQLLGGTMEVKYNFVLKYKNTFWKVITHLLQIL